MIHHTKLNLYSFKEAIKETETFKKIGNTAFQKLYFNQRTLDAMYDNYGQAIRYGIEYLKQKPSLSAKDVAIIEEIINK